MSRDSQRRSADAPRLFAIGNSVVRKVAKGIFRFLRFGPQIVFSAYRLKHRGNVALESSGVAEMLHVPVAAGFVGLLQLRTGNPNLDPVFNDFLKAVQSPVHFLLELGCVEGLAYHVEIRREIAGYMVPEDTPP